MASKKLKINDLINNPSHYNTGDIECIEAIQSSMTTRQFQGYLKGNVMKYVWRHEYKGKMLDDLRKARWYLNKLIATHEDNLNDD
jgi:hypothetical protein